MSKSKNTDALSDQRPILVAVDFSDDSMAALHWACEYSLDSGVPLVLLHVVHDPVSSPGFYQADSGDNLQSMQEVAETKMASFLEEAQRTGPDESALKGVGTRFVAGLPAGRIIEMADRMNARLIVMGSKGLSGLPHVLLGSVAERVVQQAQQPVTVVKAAK